MHSHIGRSKCVRFALLVLALALAACGTPQSVKDLSAEQLKVQAAYAKALGEYMSVVKSFAETSASAAKGRIDARDKQIFDLQDGAVSGELAKATQESEVRRRLPGYREGIVTQLKQSGDQKQAIDANVKLLVSKQGEFLKVQQDLIESQTKLDEYIRLEKADEAAFKALFGDMSVLREKANRIVDEIRDVASKLPAF